MNIEDGSFVDRKVSTRLWWLTYGLINNTKGWDGHVILRAIDHTGSDNWVLVLFTCWSSIISFNFEQLNFSICLRPFYVAMRLCLEGFCFLSRSTVTKQNSYKQRRLKTWLKPFFLTLPKH